MVVSFVCLVPVRLLCPSMAVLYHENGKLQSAYQVIIPLLRHSNCAKFRTMRPTETISSHFRILSYSHFYDGEGAASIIFISEREYTC